MLDTAEHLLLSEAIEKNNSLSLVITSSAQEANSLTSVLNFFLKDKNAPILSFPDRETLPYDVFSPHQDLISKRLETLSKLSNISRGALIVPITTLMNYLPPKEFISSRTFIYNLKTKEKKLVKEQLIPSGHNSNEYIVERLECEGHDGRIIPITITRKKTTKLDGNSNLLLYGYGSYGNSMWPSFSSVRLSLINRDIIWATAHIRGGMERGMKWWKEGKLLNKKNTFQDYISCVKFLIDKKYTSKKKIIGMGGSAGGLLMGAVVNEKPDLFLGMIMAVPFVDSLTTNLDHSLPLTIGEFDEFGNAKDNKEHFEYIYSYAPYNNIKKMDYPNILITTSLSDNRVLFDEPLKFTAKLRDYKTDNNLLLLKTEMNAGHGGKSGRDGVIEEIAFDYAFICKIAKKI